MLVTWKSHLCGGGLESSIKEAIDDHADAQGAMNAPARKNKKGNIWDETTAFLQQKQMFWRNCSDGQHLFGSGKEQQKMRKYFGRRSVGSFTSLCSSRMIMSRRNSARVHMERVQCVSPRLVSWPSSDVRGGGGGVSPLVSRHDAPPSPSVERCVYVCACARFIYPRDRGGRVACTTRPSTISTDPQLGGGRRGVVGCAF